MTQLTETGTAKRVKTKNWDLHYHEAGTGHPLVLLHGGGPGASAWSNFQPNIPALAERFRVLALDLPGWGKSQPATFTERDPSGAVAEFLDTLETGPAAVVGNSMGGATAIRLSYERPDLVSHLITMGPPSGTPGLFDPQGISEGLKALGAAYFHPSEATMKALTEVMVFDSSNVTDELIAERLANALANQQHLDNWTAGVAKGPIIELDQARIATIQPPALLMHGRDDRVVNFSESVRLCQLIPDSRLLVVSRCGHWLQLEHAAEFNRTVTNFVAV